jgi:hypothetical protein
MLSGRKITMFETKRLARDGQRAGCPDQFNPVSGPKRAAGGQYRNPQRHQRPQKAEDALQQYHDQLEELVQERTAELADANRRLKATDRRAQTGGSGLEGPVQLIWKR